MGDEFKTTLVGLGKLDDTPLNMQEWQGLWKVGKTPWQNDRVHGSLIKFYHRMRPTYAFSRVYVPLCGKTVDMAWFYHKGLFVVGSDIADEAGASFAAEHPDLSIERRVIQLSDGQQIFLYESPDKRLRIYICSYELMPHICEEKFDMVWDRGAFVALNPLTRQRFVESTADILQKHCHWLQDSLEYSDEFHGLPPHSVSEADLRHIFGQLMDVELLWVDDSSRNTPCTLRVMLYKVLNI